ncbi:MAG: helix-turn-helix domain-containing protein [Mediterraneibacter faecis]
MNKQKHLNLEARILIETMLNEHHSFKSIARELGKDCTTISKEIKAHICFEKTGALGRSFNDCRVAFLHQCSCRSFASTAPTRITNRAGLAAGVLPPASLTKNIFALSSPNLPMSVMAVSSVLGVLSKNVFTRHLMLRRNMNRSEVNPVLGLPFLKRNLSSSMMWYLLSSKKGSPFITLRYIMLTNL